MCALTDPRACVRPSFRPSASVRRHICTALSMLFLLWAYGCGDMPIVEEGQIAQAPPRIVVGPYLTEADDDRLVIRFRTDQRCVAGVRFQGTRHRVERFATFDTNHAIPVRGLRSDTPTQAHVLLDNEDGPAFSLRGQPALGGPVALAFWGGPARADSLAAAARRLDGMPFDGLIFCERPLPPDASLQTWQQRCFQPLQSVAQRTPFFLPPWAHEALPRGLFPGRARSFWSRSFGCVHVTGIDARMLKTPALRKRTLAKLDKDLAARPPAAVWTVLILNEPLFGARHVNARILDALGERLERSGVDLVLSTGLGYYHRTLPLRSSPPGAVRYVALGRNQDEEVPGKSRTYTAVLSGHPHVGVLMADQGRLWWRTFSLRGGVIDEVDLAVGGKQETVESALDRQEILTRSLATLTLRYEVVAIARQACRAVADPDRPARLRLRLTNPSPRPFEGRLDWDLPRGSKWRVEPQSRRFSLAPGRVGYAPFQIIPSQSGNAVPTLTVDAGTVGYARQPLVITRLRQTTVPLVQASCRVDGYLNEAFWKQATEISGFRQIHNDAKPSQVLRSWLAATPAGLCVAVRCEESRSARGKPAATRRDGPVHRDESIELFLDPSRQGRDYYQLAVSVHGTALDRSSQLGLRWNPTWKHAVQMGKTDEGVSYYDVEVLIPYAAFGLSQPPKPGAAWAFNLTRNDYGETAGGRGPSCEIVQWAPTHGSNARSGLYGLIRFTPLREPDQTAGE